jgi:hypothetical protein
MEGGDRCNVRRKEVVSVMEGGGGVNIGEKGRWGMVGERLMGFRFEKWEGKSGY